MGISNQSLLDTGEGNEIYLELLSFSGGENQISEDHVTQSNEARTSINFEPLSIGGMQRMSGINQIASGAAPVTEDKFSVLGHYHYKDSASTGQPMGVIEGDLVVISGAAVLTASGGSGLFTADKECTAVDGGNAMWITNSTDNLKRYAIESGAGAIADVPTKARDGIYKHKQRLFAEGGDTTVYSSRAGTGNWMEADAWSAANDASNIDLPDYTTGSVPNFPSGNEIAVFTKFGCYSVFNFPNVAYRAIPNSFGCSDRKSLSVGNGGVFGFGEFPTRAIWFWNGTTFTSLTEGVDWIDDIRTSIKMRSCFRENRYWIAYNDDATKSYTNKLKFFDVKFGGWFEREINSDVGDSIGELMVLTKNDNELYGWSSQTWNAWQLETGTDDDGNDTQAQYKTKEFTSRDFSYASGGKAFPIDEISIKLTKIRMQFYGTAGSITLQWTGDSGVNSGSISYDLTAEGDLINSTFTLNSSKVITAPPDSNEIQSVSNNAVARRFSFQILHNGSSTKPKIKKIKIYGLALEE